MAQESSQLSSEVPATAAEQAPSHATTGRRAGLGAYLKKSVEASPDSSECFGIIVHCHLRWDFVWQRPQQIFSRLAQHHRVVFIEDALVGEGDARLDISEPHPNVVRVVPMVPHALGGDVDEQCRALMGLIGRALLEHPLLSGYFLDPVQWFYSPMTAPCFLGRFGAGTVVYDCMDELANFRFAPPDIGARERTLMARADVVFTGGHQLYEAKSLHHDNVHFHGCGVDVGHFGQARQAHTEVPLAIAELPQPVFGYVGVIDERLDYELIERLAARFPEASVVMAGPLAKVERSQLPTLPNIHWLGQRPYSELPALVKGFDVCLMPFALNEATRFINPTKTLEYMAAGKPIVSTAIADVVRNFAPIVDVAYTHEGFLQAVESAWRERDDGAVARGVERASGASWEAIVQSMRQEISNAVMRQRRVGAAASVLRTVAASSGVAK